MKRIFSVAMILSLFLLNGCSIKSERISVVPFSAQAEITDEDIVLVGYLTYNGDGDVTFEINRPDELKNVKLSVCGKSEEISFDGVAADFSLEGCLSEVSHGLALLQEAAEDGIYMSADRYVYNDFSYVFDESKSTLSAINKDNFRCRFFY